MSYESRVLATVAPAFDGCKVSKESLLNKIIRRTVYGDIINRIGCSMFKWNLPAEVLNDVPSDFIELATNTGVSVVYKIPYTVSFANGGRWACTPLKWTGTLRNDGTSDDFTTRGTDYAITKRDLDKYVIIKNNAFMSDEYLNIDWFADMLNNTDIAENALIKWCRITPVAKATSGIDAAKLREVLKAIWDGVEPFGIISDDTKMITGQPMSRDDAVLKLTDENIIEKMHFLSEFHYELIRRLCNLYNIPFRTTAKSAQNLESELHNTDIFSQMTTTGRKEFREKAAAEMRSVFGWENASVEIGEKFKAEDDVINANVESDIKATEAGVNVSRETIDEPDDGEPGGNEKDGGGDE